MKKQRGLTGIEVAILVTALSSVVTATIPLFAKPEQRCWSGYLFDGMSGRQLIGENGGGIPCVVQDEANKGGQQ